MPPKFNPFLLTQANLYNIKGEKIATLETIEVSIKKEKEENEE